MPRVTRREQATTRSPCRGKKGWLDKTEQGMDKRTPYGSRGLKARSLSLGRVSSVDKMIFCPRRKGARCVDKMEIDLRARREREEEGCRRLGPRGGISLTLLLYIIMWIQHGGRPHFSPPSCLSMGSDIMPPTCTFVHCTCTSTSSPKLRMFRPVSLSGEKDLHAGG